MSKLYYIKIIYNIYFFVDNNNSIRMLLTSPQIKTAGQKYSSLREKVDK